MGKKFSTLNSFKPALIVFLILGVIQSTFTNIGLDESYYWRFSQDLDWGYFDHPPMVALMMAIGKSILPGTLGIRLMTIVLSVLTYYIIWLLIPEVNRQKEGSTQTFLLLILTSPLLVIYSFITTPDVPLIFFSAIYLYLFKDFLEEQNLKKALLLGIVMACLIYSKYHGILVILISVLSRIRLFKSPYFYLAGIVGIILYIPHLWWQYEHDFISFNYHLSYRSVQFYVKNVYMYFVNTILVLNPFLFPLFIIGYIKFGRKAGIHNKTFNTILWIFLSFFAFTSFRGHVEPQWIVVITIPMIVYFHQYILHDEKIKKYFFPLAYTSIGLIIIARIVLMLPLDINSEFHKPDRTFYETLNEIAGDRPVIFANSYTQSSRYSFYTREPSFSYNFVSFRKNQYDLWPYHDLFHKKDVLFCTFHELGDYKDSLIDNSKHLYFKEINNIPIVNNLKVEVLNYKAIIDDKSAFEVTFNVSNPYKDDIDFKEFDIKWMLYFFYLDKERAFAAYMRDGDKSIIKAHTSVQITGIFDVDVPANAYTFGIHIYPSQVFPISVSKRTYPIQVKSAK